MFPRTGGQADKGERRWICNAKPLCGTRLLNVSCLKPAYCSREDSNLHGLPHTVLSRTRLPIPPRERSSLLFPAGAICRRRPLGHQRVSFDETPALQPTRIGANNRNQRVGNQAAAREQDRAVEQLRQRFEALAGQFQGQLQLNGGGMGFEMRDGNAVITGPNGQRMQIRIPEGTDPGVVEKLIVAPPTRVQVRPGGGQDR